jgi:hypothetical protein
MAASMSAQVAGVGLPEDMEGCIQILGYIVILNYEL